MDLEELRAFLAVAETGSFLAAEQRLRQSRATLRRRVGSLETRAGVTLLQRTPQGMALTEAGAMLAERGALMMQEASALVSSIREMGREPSGVLRVLLPVGLPPHVMVPMFAALRSAWPRLSVRARFSDDPVGGLLDGVDLAIDFGSRPLRGPWIVREILRVREWLVAHSDYLARRGTPVSLSELATHELFAWEAPGEDPHVWPLLSGGTFSVEPALTATSVNVLRQCALSALGIALLPDALLPDPGAAEGALVAVMPAVVGRERTVRIVVPSVLAEVPRVRALLELLERFAAER